MSTFTDKLTDKDMDRWTDARMGPRVSIVEELIETLKREGREETDPYWIDRIAKFQALKG